MADPALIHVQVPAGYSATAPLTLARAAAIAFPGGEITARSLRSEKDKGNLATFKLAGRVMTTLAAIDAMIEQCQDQSRKAAPPKAPDSFCARPARTAQPSSSFATDRTSAAQAAALMTAQGLIRRSRPTSPRNTTRDRSNVVPMRS